MSDDEEKILWICIALLFIIISFIGGAAVGVSWYDSKYRPEIDSYLKDCKR